MAEKKGESRPEGKTRNRSYKTRLFAGSAAFLCGILLLVAAFVSYGDGLRAHNASSPLEQRLPSPGERTSLLDFVWAENGQQLYALTDSARAREGLGSQASAGTILWVSEDGGESWAAKAELPDLIPDSREVRDGSIFPDGSFVFSTSFAGEQGTVDDDSLAPQVYYVDSAGKARLLKGIDEQARYADSLRILGFVAKDRVVFSCDVFEEGQSRQRAQKILLYDVALGEVICECQSAQLKNGLGCFLYASSNDVSSFVVYGDEGAACFDAETGDELLPEPSCVDFCVKHIDGDANRVALFSKNSQVFCATSSGLYCYDAAEGKESMLQTFDDLLFGDGSRGPSFGVANPDNSCLLAYSSQRKMVISKIQF